jgi:hypothetical protein
MGDLPLQVRQIDRVAVDQRDAADAGAAQVQRRRRTQAAGADDERVRRAQTLLALDTDLVEQDVARLAQQLLVGQLSFFSALAAPDLLAPGLALLACTFCASRSAALLLTTTGWPLSRFSAWISGKSLSLPYSGILGSGFFLLSISSSSSLRACSRACSRAASYASDA